MAPGEGSDWAEGGVLVLVLALGHHQLSSGGRVGVLRSHFSHITELKIRMSRDMGMLIHDN